MEKEYETVKSTKEINTIETLKRDFRKLGIKENMTLIVHSSLSSIGWVCGGPVAVIDALIDIIGEGGNIIMPSQSGDLSDPANWCNPPVPKDWHQIIRDTMPVYDVDKTPCRGMGIVVDTFRNYKGVVRSNHPQVSFIAWGKDKEYITSNHSLEYGLSDKSPLGKLYNMDTYVLLLGVDYDSNTSLHLAEYRSNCREEITNGAPILENNQRVWKEYKDIDLDTEYFIEIGTEFEETHTVNMSKIGNAHCKLFNQKECIDFATKLLKEIPIIN